MDEILIVPNGNPPHKECTASTLHRFKMVYQGIKDLPQVELDYTEFHTDKPHFTLNTMRELKSKHQESRLIFLMGDDVVPEVKDWNNAETFMKEFEWRGIDRVVKISSTEVRDRMKKGLDVSHLVPNAVYKYIQENGLYT